MLGDQGGRWILSHCRLAGCGAWGAQGGVRASVLGPAVLDMQDSVRRTVGALSVWRSGLGPVGTEVSEGIKRGSARTVTAIVAHSLRVFHRPPGTCYLPAPSDPAGMETCRD